ncbi:MAG TPA: DUF2946 family protein [Burkholderiales bacterium]|nr:DUF2946 family protein [Burkholderiales bacterium]
MDDIVRRAMQKWPNVPDVFGWLRLDRRGDWLLRVTPEVFDPIRNPAMAGYIARNYTHDERGRWYFQNGPQRVFVSLECTPFVYRLDDRRAGWRAHTGVEAGAPTELLVNDDSLVLVTPLGPGVVLDRDLEFLLDNMHDDAGNRLDAGFLDRGAQAPRHVEVLGERVSLSRLPVPAVAERFGFVQDPQEGEKDV